MKRFESDYLENAAPEQREAYLMLRTDHLRKMLCLVLIWLAVTIGLIVLFGGLAGSYSAAAIVIWLISAVILMIVTAIGQNRFMKRVRSTPELMPPALDPETAAAWKNADLRYLSEQASLSRDRSALLVGSFFLAPLMPLFLIIGIVRTLTAKCSPASPCVMLEHFAGRISRTVSGISLSGIVLCFALFLFSAMAEFTGKSHVTAMNSSARMLSAAVEAFQIDLDAQDEDPNFYGTYIFNGQSGDERLYTGISKYFTDSSKLNFALRFGQDGSLSEVWCSYRQHPLTESDLVPLDFDTQKKIAGSLFRRRDLIGYYYNQSKPAALPE